MLLSGTAFGIVGETWEKAKDQARALMIETAEAKKVIPYSDLVKEITAVTFEAHDKRLFHLLGQISRDEDAAGRGMLTAVVVHKHDKKPGAGFYELAKHLGRKNSGDTDKFWIDELNTVYAIWSKSSTS